MKCVAYGENVFPDKDGVIDRVEHAHHHHVATLLHTYLPHVRLERLDYRLPHLQSCGSKRVEQKRAEYCPLARHRVLVDN